MTSHHPTNGRPAALRRRAGQGQPWQTSPHDMPPSKKPSKTIKQERAAKKLKLEQATRRDVAAAIRDR